MGIPLGIMGIGIVAMVNLRESTTRAQQEKLATIKSWERDQDPLPEQSFWCDMGIVSRWALGETRQSGQCLRFRGCSFLTSKAVGGMKATISQS